MQLRVTILALVLLVGSAAAQQNGTASVKLVPLGKCPGSSSLARASCGQPFTNMRTLNTGGQLDFVSYSKFQPGEKVTATNAASASTNNSAGGDFLAGIATDTNAVLQCVQTLKTNLSPIACEPEVTLLGGKQGSLSQVAPSGEYTVPANGNFIVFVFNPSTGRTTVEGLNFAISAASGSGASGGATTGNSTAGNGTTGGSTGNSTTGGSTTNSTTTGNSTAGNSTTPGHHSPAPSGGVLPTNGTSSSNTTSPSTNSTSPSTGGTTAPSPASGNGTSPSKAAASLAQLSWAVLGAAMMVMALVTPNMN